MFRARETFLFPYRGKAGVWAKVDVRERERTARETSTQDVDRTSPLRRRNSGRNRRRNSGEGTAHLSAQSQGMKMPNENGQFALERIPVLLGNKEAKRPAEREGMGRSTELQKEGQEWKNCQREGNSV